MSPADHSFVVLGQQERAAPAVSGNPVEGNADEVESALELALKAIKRRLERGSTPSSLAQEISAGMSGSASSTGFTGPVPWGEAGLRAVGTGPWAPRHAPGRRQRRR